ncbi:MAG: F0F1 ATP synthase subunit gamma [Gammaproteobacteria bacterium]
MAVGRGIRAKIKSIQNTRKITGAMELVAASKMRKAQVRMAASRPYANKIRQVISHVAKSHSEYHHPYLMTREPKRVGFIIVATDRGLCGSLNINLFRNVVHTMQQWHERGVEIDLCTVGHKAEVFFSRLGGNIVAKTERLGDTPSINDLVGVVKVMLDAYDEKQLDALFIANNEFINTMTQRPMINQLLPVEIPTHDVRPGYWDYIYEPDAKALLDLLLVRYIEMQAYQALVENVASEQAARMVAMKNATDNAGDLINDLQLIYNKARQAAITQEISEIVAGAAAVTA